MVTDGGFTLTRVRSFVYGLLRALFFRGREEDLILW